MHNNDTIQLARRLIQQASLTPRDASCQFLIADILKPSGFTHHHWALPHQVEISLYTYGQGPRCMAFAGHTDVVPAQSPDQWRFPPFQAQIQDDVLYGRGCVDMKGSVAAMVACLNNWAKTHPPQHGQVVLLLVSDEEASTNVGMATLVEHCRALGIQPDLCWVGEPTSEHHIGDTLKIGRRGSLHVHLELQGQSGHVAYPEDCRNPIHGAQPILKCLLSERWDEGHAEFPPTALQCVHISSDSGASNVVPDQLTLRFNMRYAPCWEEAALIARIGEVLAPWKPDLTWNCTRGALPYHRPPGILSKRVRETARACFGREPVWSTCGGTSDARFLADLECDLIEAGLRHATAHQMDEHAPCADILALQHWMERTLSLVMADQTT